MNLAALSSAQLENEFDRLMGLARRASHAQPRTAASVASASRYLAALGPVTALMRQRAAQAGSTSRILLKINNAWSDFIVGSVVLTTAQVGEIGRAAGSAAGGTVGAAVKQSGLGLGLVVVVVGIAASIYLVKR